MGCCAGGGGGGFRWWALFVCGGFCGFEESEESWDWEAAAEWDAIWFFLM